MQRYFNFNAKKSVLWVPVSSFLGEMGPNGALSGKACRRLH